MKWFNNLKIGLKLILGFVGVALIAGFVGWVGIISISTIEQKSAEMYSLNTLPLSQISSVMLAYQRNRVFVRELAMETNQAKEKGYFENIKANDRIIETQLALFEKTIRTDAGMKEMNRLKSMIVRYNPIRQQIIDLALIEQDSKAIALMHGPVAQLATDIENSIQSLVDMKVNLAKSKSIDNTATAKKTIVTMAAFIVIGMILAIALGIFISRIISKPINELVLVARKIAEGDLNVDIQVRSKDEIGILSEAFDKMAANTNEVIANINSSAEQVAAGSKQVSISSQALSQGSTEQASSLEEITSSITEIAAQTKQNALNANQANEMAMTVKDSAIEGNQQMKSMLNAMKEINDSSANISKIIKVIDEIAFQTNILALNAAVEAARAGQHGKGFAVVAEEVRNLAARSANAAKETTGLIEGSIKKVEAGTKIANDTAEALSKIVEGVNTASNLIAEIAAASNQQASAITQINQGVEQVSQVTQSNTATAEESASASEELSSQAELLKNMVARFKFRKNQTIAQLKGVSSDMIKALEDLISQKNTGYPSATEAPPKSMVKINLDDAEFGKYQ